jgi:A/G-specific adenine glycosylase
VRARLLAWYDAEARSLAWRTGPAARAAGERPDPYRVWLSEVMLQQTTTPHATPYFVEFTRRWPTVSDLAAAPDAEVMGAWAGLGYYARARNLLKAARAVAGGHGGVFPGEEEALRALPGFGPYTAAAVAAIAFDRAANVVDGNVERVVSRLWAVETPLPAAKPELRRLAATLVADDRPGDWAQALMDLGATVCRPRSPLCGRCPVAEDCAAFASGAPETFPRKTPKPVRTRRFGAAYVLTRGDEVALVRRPESGLLGGMPGLPTSAWSTEAPAPEDGAPAALAWRPAGEIDHVFTHFPLTLSVLRANGEAATPVEWTPVAEAERILPTVFRKALAAGLGRLV